MSPPGQAAPHLLLRLAVVTLGANQPGVAAPIARAAFDRAPRAALLVECAGLLETDPAAAADRIARFDQIPGEFPAEERAVGLIVKSEHHRRRGQVRTAIRFAEQAAASTQRAVVGVEARLALARAAGDARRPAQGLAAIERALALARETVLPDLLAACHREGERLFKLGGDHDAARHALRSARAIWRRHAADRSAPRSLPLHALFDLCRG
jgi:hypothetical protein